MANSFITPRWVLREVARVLVNNLKFSQNVDRTYDNKFEVSGAKVGYTVDARLPQRFRVTTGQAFQPQPITDQTVPVSLTDQINIGTSWSTADATMIVQDVQKRYVMPAAEALANDIDYKGLSRMYSKVWNSVGTPGTTPSSNLTFLQAGVKLTMGAVPEDNRVGMLDPLTSATMANANFAAFNPANAISQMWHKGQVASNWMGIEEVYQTQNIAKHTTGSFTVATPTVNGASQTGSSLVTQAWASGATVLEEGDVFTIAGVFPVNPQNYVTTGVLQDFVVTSRITDTAGAMTIQIAPPIITSGPLQTVTNSPANGAAIIPRGSTITTGSGTMTATVSPQNLIYHPDAFILAVADLDGDLAGAEVTRVRSKQLNIALRYVKQYNGLSDQKLQRIDGLIGWTAFRPELAARVWA
jgi:P22 coat protein - gene protein 5